MCISKLSDGLYKIRWREGGRQRSLRVHGCRELAKKILRKKLSLRDANRHLDIKKEVNYQMSELIDQYWLHFGRKKVSADREKSIVEGIRSELGRMFVREVDGYAVQRWYENLTGKRGLADNTAARHFNVMRHMMHKASTIWSKQTGIDKNPASLIEVNRPDDSRERFLSEDELCRLKIALDEKVFRKDSRDFNQTHLRMRLIVLIALSTGMRSGEIHQLRWPDVMYSARLIKVRMKLKKGKERYVPMTSQLAEEIRRYPKSVGESRIFPPKGGVTSRRQRLDGSFAGMLERANISDFRFHDLRHTFASWYMMNGGDLYELAKILGHANIKMTERYTKLGQSHIAKTVKVASQIWNLMKGAQEENKEAREHAA